MCVLLCNNSRLLSKVAVLYGMMKVLLCLHHPQLSISGCPHHAASIPPPQNTLLTWSSSQMHHHMFAWLCLGLQHMATNPGLQVKWVTSHIVPTHCQLRRTRLKIHPLFMP